MHLRLSSTPFASELFMQRHNNVMEYRIDVDWRVLSMVFSRHVYGAQDENCIMVVFVDRWIEARGCGRSGDHRRRGALSWI
jgi:hypothetical protein